MDKKGAGVLKETHEVANLSSNFYKCLLMESEEGEDVEVMAGEVAVSKKKKSQEKKKASLKALQKSQPKNGALTAKISQSSTPHALQKQPPSSTERFTSGEETLDTDNDGGQPSGNERSLTRSLMYQYPLVWIDLEMTGLDVDTDKILEIAVIITDGRLDQTIEGPSIVIHHPDSTLETMNDWCKEQHHESGLVERVRASTVSLQEAEKEVLAFVKTHTRPQACQLAGNCVYTDFWFLKKYMPSLAEHFSFVIVDVSSVRALCLRWHKSVWEHQPKKSRRHRALEDIRESIEELRYFKKMIFK